MQYGTFDQENREYVISRVDLPVSWTNYLGVNQMCTVINHTAGGYVFYKSPEYHRITRFRPNGVPMDRPGQYVYLRDDQTGKYWSVSWQPVGKPLESADYECRHGLSYSKYRCSYQGIEAIQTMFIPLNDPVELWDVTVKNTGKEPREISTFSYLEWSFHHIDMDNRNFQMSLYASGSSYQDGIIDYDLFYEENGYQYFTSSINPTSYDTVRDTFIGAYRTESNPAAVENGTCSNSSELGGNHCGSLHHKLQLQPGEEIRIIYMLGEGGHDEGAGFRAKYSDLSAVDSAFADLAAYWDKKLTALQISTPNKGMNTLINTWNLYQSEINVMFSRFASFIEVGGRTGLGYRDTAQDAMMIPHSNPEKCRSRIIELLRGLVSEGYGLHLFDPSWFDPQKEEQSFRSPTVVPTPGRDEMVHGIEDACSDDALWLISSIVEYIKETGELSLLDEVVTYADGGEGTVYEHMQKILDFSARQVGENGVCKGLRADWNDCLNLGGGESAMVSFLHHWALENFLQVAEKLNRTDDIQKYTDMKHHVKQICESKLWDGQWYLRGITQNGRKIGSHEDTEGKVHMESNTWAVISGVASEEHGRQCMDSVDEYLYTPYGLMLNSSAYSEPDDDIGFVTRVYKGLKENGAIFSHPNPWAWVAEAKLGRGSRAMKFYDALCPYHQNDQIEVRLSEPYSYCQFVVGKDHAKHGRAHHPFMTGTGGWAYFAATRYLLGVRPDFDKLIIDPCIPSDWKEFTVSRRWRNALYEISVKNPDGVEKGVKALYFDGKQVSAIPLAEPGTSHQVEVVMG